jgi:hypothetical protein
MMKTIAVLAVTLVIGMAAGSASGSVHGCHYPYGHGPQNDRSVNIGNVSARNMSCRKALTAISSGTLLRNGNLRTPRFGCHILKTYRSFGTLLGADIRCSRRKPSEAFRFSWAT